MIMDLEFSIRQDLPNEKENVIAYRIHDIEKIKDLYPKISGYLKEAIEKVKQK